MAGQRKRPLPKDGVAEEHQPRNRLKIFEEPRKNYATCVSAFENLERLRKLIRPRYTSEEEFGKWHFLDLLMLPHFTYKADLEHVLANADLPSFLERKRETFDFGGALHKLCKKTPGEQAQALLNFEGSIHVTARYIPDSTAKTRWVSSCLELLPELKSIFEGEGVSDTWPASSDPPEFDDPFDLDFVNNDDHADEQKATHIATPLMLPVDELRTFLAPGLRSGMMSTSYRQQEQNLEFITAVSIRGPVLGYEEAPEYEEYIIEIITSSAEGDVVKKARGSAELRAALGETLYSWMDATKCAQQRKRNRWTPPVKVAPKDGTKKDGDQIVMVRVTSESVLDRHAMKLKLG